MEEKEKDFRKLVYLDQNKNYGEVLPKGITARAGTIIIALVLNIPNGKSYTSTGFTDNKGLFHNYNKSFNLNLEQFANIFPFNMGYGKVLKVGKGIETEVKEGDKVVLRSLPDDSFVWDGKIFFFIREVDISCVVGSDNTELENYNKS
jgi:hypothetical protein